MIADVPVVVVASRRWWIALSAALHAIAIAIAALAPRLEIEALERPGWPPIGCPMPAPPPGAPLPCHVGTAACGFGIPTSHALLQRSCDVPAVLHEPVPVVSLIAKPGQLVRTGGHVPRLWHASHATLEVCVDANGAAIWAYPVRSSGDECVDFALAVAARSWRFAPLGESACGEVKP